MSIMPPIFPISEPHHYSDYGFDPEINYFQVLEEARRHTKRAESRPIDAVHFKLSKPISKDHERTKSKKRKAWWKSALGFLKRAKSGDDNDGDGYSYRATSGPIYVVESVSGRSRSGPLLEAEVAATPYVSLREVDFGDGYQISAMPIYLVT